MSLDGLLVIDKPEGPTSHDVVARLRRVLRERRIGHTGTLDPLASGVLPLVVGRATRLAQFLTSDDKRYPLSSGWDGRRRPTIGRATRSAKDRDASDVTRDAVERALDRFRGTFLQAPPAYSAKKVAGVAAYALARRGAAPTLPPAEVTIRDVAVTDMVGPDVTLDLHCSAGFYVRSLAHDLGEVLGCGGYLWRLRRTASGAFTLAESVGLDAIDADPDLASQRLLPMAALLTDWPAVTLTDEGAVRVRHGALLGQADCAVWHGYAAGSPEKDVSVRVLGPDGALVALAAWVGPGREARLASTPGGPGRPGRDGLPALHPSIVLV